MRQGLIWATGALCVLFATQAPAQQAPQAVPVGVVPAALKPVNKQNDFVGRVQAVQRVNLRARVSGYIDEIPYTEGAMVKEGELLFRIDKAPYVAAVQQAQGAVDQAQATLTNAKLERARAEELVKSSAVSVAQRDQRVAAELSAQGSLLQAQAALATAALNLGYTEITAPISGRVGQAAFTRGNLVGPDSGTLTTIVSQDPMYVAFPVSQREFLDLEKEKGADGKPAPRVVRLRFSDGQAYAPEGRINFVDVTVDRSTDTVLVRASFPNPNGYLVDGQFVRVAVVVEKPQEKILVPQAALLSDQQGVYVFVADDGKAAIRRLRLGGSIGAESVVEEGLKPGDQVVVNGIQLLRPGVPVVAKPVTPIGG